MSDSRKIIKLSDKESSQNNFIQKNCGSYFVAVPKEFRKGCAALAIFIALGLFLAAIYVVHVVEYRRFIMGKEKCEATVERIVVAGSTTHGSTYDVYIRYTAGEKEYVRTLGTDTTISFATTSFSNLVVGDKVTIYYNPADPDSIAAENTLSTGRGIAVFGLMVSVSGLILLILFIRAQRGRNTEGNEMRQKLK